MRKLVAVFFLLYATASQASGSAMLFNTVTVSGIQSDSDNGASLAVSADMAIMIPFLSVKAVASNIYDKTVYNGYVSASMPCLRRTMCYIDYGTGSKGRSYRYGISVQLSEYDERRLRGYFLSATREEYPENEVFDNTQIGVTWLWGKR